MVPTDVPEVVVRRLPLYLRALTALATANHLVTSSQELADLLGMSSAQIRKDLSYCPSCATSSGVSCAWTGAGRWCWWGQATWVMLS